MQPTKTWATTRAGAVAQLNYFIKNHFEKFGPYEDAMALDSWALHHSLLSPYLNNGLLHASEVIDAADWVMVPNVIGMAVHADGIFLIDIKRHL